MIDLNDVMSGIVAIFFVLIFLAVLLPELSKFNPFSGIIFFLATILVIVGIILSIFKGER